MLDTKNVHAGHRGRMKSKFDKYGARIFDTYELLEMLLYSVIPQLDTNPISKRLLERFGSLDGVFSAKREELVLVEGIGSYSAGFITKVGALLHSASVGSIDELPPVFEDVDSAGEFFVDYFSGTNDYAVALMLLDNSMRLISVKTLYNCDYSSGAIKAKPFVNAAIRCGATVALVAHTHPRGPLYPTAGDIATDDMLRRELASAGVAMVESYVVTGERFVGVKAQLSARFYQHPAVARFVSSEQGAGRSVPNKTGRSGRVSRDLAPVLSYVMNGKSAQDCADSIDAELHSFSVLFATQADAIGSVVKVTPSALRLIRLIGAIASRRVTDAFKLPSAYSDEDIEKYVKGLFLDKAVETVYLFCLDERGRITDVSYMGEGSVNFSDASPRRLLENAVRASARTVFVAHNHPRGSCEPSAEDVSTTAKLVGAFSSAGITLARHYIVSGNECRVITLDDR